MTSTKYCSQHNQSVFFVRWDKIDIKLFTASVLVTTEGLVVAVLWWYPNKQAAWQGCNILRLRALVCKLNFFWKIVSNTLCMPPDLFWFSYFSIVPHRIFWAWLLTLQSLIVFLFTRYYSAIFCSIFWFVLLVKIKNLIW